MYEGRIINILHKDNVKITNGYTLNESIRMELKSRFTDSNVHEIISKVLDSDLEDIGKRVEPINLNIKNILVTGGAGFIGSFLVRKLVISYPEFNIVVVDKLDYCGSLNNLKMIKGMPNYSFIKGDITSSDFMTFILKEKKIDTIYHLAAQTHVDNSFGDSFEFTKNNILGTHVLLEAAKVHNIKRFIHVSTDEVYGEVAKTSPDCHEESILAPSNPYSATKAAAECLVKAYHKSFGLPIIITRSNNIYGPYQYPEKICSKFICSLIRGGKCYIHGDGSNSRKYLYVGDLINALDLILHLGHIGEIYNIGTNFEISNLDLAKIFLQQFNISERDQHNYLEFVQDRPFNDRRYSVDYTKLKELGWKPKVSWEDGIKKTIAWYKKNCEKWWGDISNALVPHPLKTLPQSLDDYNYL
ncbi:2512_t:CDS:2 [Funneliformis mosseae]|uniref:2512_t:CDS:1 n=1 Tax=Funneliformis mosseae TaxID=27381 RepID=A0A9N9EMC1_FUNMO|nr:2512_t:CDS:2 [Funneliformis mosseae]